MNTNEMIAYIQRLEAENAKLKQYVKECHGIIEYLNNENNKWSDEYNIEHDLNR